MTRKEIEDYVPENCTEASRRAFLGTLVAGAVAGIGRTEAQQKLQFEFLPAIADEIGQYPQPHGTSGNTNYNPDASVPENLGLFWKSSETANIESAEGQPVVANGRVYTYENDTESFGMLEGVIGLDLQNGERDFAVSAERRINDEIHPIAVGEALLYGSTDQRGNDQSRSVDASSESSNWEVSSLVRAANTNYALSTSSQIIDTDTGEILYDNVGPDTPDDYALFDNSAYFISPPDVVAVDCETGNEDWSTAYDELSSGAETFLTATPDHLIITNKDGAVQVADRETGEALGTLSTEIESRPAVGQGYIFLDGVTSRLIEIDSLETVWTIPHRMQRPVMVTDGVFGLNEGSELIVLNLNDGSEQLRTTLATASQYRDPKGMAVVNGLVIVNDGEELIALSPDGELPTTDDSTTGTDDGSSTTDDDGTTPVEDGTTTEDGTAEGGDDSVETQSSPEDESKDQTTESDDEGSGIIGLSTPQTVGLGGGTVLAGYAAWRYAFSGASGLTDVIGGGGESSSPTVPDQPSSGDGPPTGMGESIPETGGTGSGDTGVETGGASLGTSLGEDMLEEVLDTMDAEDISDIDEFEEIAATNNVVLSKTIDIEELPAPALSYEIENHRDTAVTAYLEETLPEQVSPDDIGLDDEYGGEYWFVGPDQMMFERELEPGESVQTLVAVKDTALSELDRMSGSPEIEVEKR